MKFKNRLLLSAIILALFLTGCTSTNFDTNTSNIVAEYVAGTLVKYSYDYKDRYTDLSDKLVFEDETIPEESTSEEESETETEKPAIDPVDESTSNSKEEESTTAGDGTWAIGNILKLDPLTVKYSNYTTSDTISVGEIFEMEADEGNMFVVVNFAIINKSDKSVTVNNSTDKTVVKLYVNEKPYINHASLVLNDITNLKDVKIDAGNSYDGVIIFMLPKEEIKDIKSMKLLCNEIEYRIK